MATKKNVAKEERALAQMIKIEQEYDSMMVNRRDKWLDWYKIYRLFRTEEKDVWQSQIFIAKIYEVIERIVPSLISHDPKFVVSARFNQNTVYINQLRDYLRFIWDEDDMEEKIESLVKGGVIYGTYIFKVDWLTTTMVEKSIETKTDDETGELYEQEIEEEIVRSGRPTGDIIDIFDFKTDPFQQNLEDSYANIQIRTGVSIAELKDAGIYHNLDEVEGLAEKTLADTTTVEKREKLQSQGITTTYIDKGYTVKEYWGLFSATGDPKDEVEYVITSVNDAVVIRCEVNEKGRPFEVFRDKIVPGEFYGIGEIEPLEDLQIELNTLRNQRMDYTNLVLNPEWIISSNSGINPSQLIHKPNNVIITDDMNGLRILDKPGVPPSGYQEEAQILRDFQTISQTTDVTDTGGVMGFNNTATGVRQRTAQQKLVTGSIVKHLEKAIAGIGRKFLIMTKHNMDDSVFSRVVDVDREAKVKFQELGKEVFEDVEEGFKIKVEAGSTLEDSYIDTANQAVAFGNTSIQYAQAGVPVKLDKVYKDILTKTFFITNPEDYVSQEPETQDTGQVQTAPEEQLAAAGAQLQPTMPGSI